MMRAPIVWTIFRKEILETLRDRRTLLMMIGLPVLVYPLMLIGVSRLQLSRSAALQAQSSDVAVWGEVPEALLHKLEGLAPLRLHPWAKAPANVRSELEAGRLAPPPSPRPTPPGASPVAAGTPTPGPEHPVQAAAREALEDELLHSVLVAWPGLVTDLERGALGHMTIYYDSVQQDSGLARNRLEGALAAFRQDELGRRERAASLPEGFTEALSVQARNVAPQRRRVGQLLGTLLPFILIVLSLMGGFYPAIDLTAGEKERGTMQTLLVAPLSPVEIIAGKFLAVWSIALIAGLANVMSLAATLSRLVPGHELSVPLAVYALTFLMLLPVTFFICAVFLAVASFAKDFKDGQNFLTPLYMALALPAGVTMVPGIELSAWTAFVPVVNIALLIKALLQGEAPVELAFLTLLASAAYSMLAILLAARVFEREQVLLGGRESARTVLGLSRQSGGLPGPSFVLVFYCVVLVSLFYGSLLLERLGTVAMLLVVQLGFFLLPALAAVLAFGFDARRALALRLPSLRAVIASLVLGLSAWTLAAGVLVRLLPPPEELGEALDRLLSLSDPAFPLWQLWLLVGVLPAFCEELCFRGLVQSGMRRLGPVLAIGVTALLFGLAHASIYRLLPTLYIGALCGYAVWRSGSILSAILVHAVSNGLLATLARDGQLARSLGMEGAGALPWLPTVAGGALVLAALAMLRSLPERERGD
jgi:sodium transport system permease protein